MKHLLMLALSAALAGSLPAQAASVTPYGSGCTFLGQTLAIGATGLPQLGSTCTLTYTGPNLNTQLSTQPFLGLGLQATNLPIPPSILWQQPPNCTQWIVPDVLLAMPPSTTGGYVDQVAIVVPNSPGLIGFSFVAQWLVIVIQCGFVPPCTFDAVPTSDALQLTIGL